MTSYLETVSEVLGEYMLKGWTLTDKTCPHCHTTPLMREPTAHAQRDGRNESQRIEFCGRCQGAPGAPIRPPAQTSTFWNEAVPEPTSLATSSTSPGPSRSTDLSTPASASVPVRTTVSQSDLASSLIGQYLLKGYTLLSEICPTPTCRGVPLMGHPRRRGDSSAQKRECVICGGMYGANGEVLSAPRGQAQVPTVERTTAAAESSNDAARRALYEEGARINAGSATAVVAAPVSRAAAAESTDENEDVDMELDALVNGTNSRVTPSVPSPVLPALLEAETSLSALLVELSSRMQQALSSGSDPLVGFVNHLRYEMKEVFAMLEKAVELREKIKAAGSV